VKKIAVFPVLAGAYRGKSVSDRALLLHNAEIDKDGTPVKALCPVNVDNLGDEVNKPATCPTCIKRAAAILRGK